MAGDHSPSVDVTGLNKALKEIPGIIAPTLMAVVAVQLAWIYLPPLAALPPLTQRPLTWLLVALIALIVYSWGGVLDDVLFDPLYSAVKVPAAGEPADTDPAKAARGPEWKPGRWLLSEDRRYFIFPVGKPLWDAGEDWRGLNSKEGDPSYRGARKVVRDSGAWSQVEGSLELSKTVRSVITPLGLVAIGCLVAALVGKGGADVWWIGTFAALLGLFALPPYFQHRIDHMVAVYRRAAELRSAGAQSEQTNPPANAVPRAGRGDGMSLVGAAVSALFLASLVGPPAPAAATDQELRRVQGEVRLVREAVSRLPDALADRLGDRSNGGAPTVTLATSGGGIPTTATARFTLVGSALIAVGLLGLVLGLAAFFRAESALGKSAGGALATVGTLSLLSGATLIDKVSLTLQMDEASLVKVIRTEVTLGLDRVPSLELRAQLIDSVGPFKLGDAQNLESGQVTDNYRKIASCWSDGCQARRRAVLVLVGSTDRVALSSAYGRRYDSNAGLAQARAEFVRSGLASAIEAERSTRQAQPARTAAANASQSAESMPPQMLTLVRGPVRTAELAPDQRANAEADDRRVQVWAIWFGLPNQALCP